LNYWAYKNRQGFRGPIEPSLFPMDKIFHSVASDYTDAYLLHRLELVALSDALREETVREWFEQEINKNGVVVESWNLISGLGHIRQETLAQAFARKFARSPVAGPDILPAESEEERRAYEESESKRTHAHPLRSNPTHIVARMDIRGQVDGDGQVFRVNPDAYQRRLSNMAVKGGAGMDPGNKGKFIPKSTDEAERQQRDSSPPRIARRLSTFFVVDDDSEEDANPQFVVGSESDDDDSVPDENEMAKLHATLDGVENDIASDAGQTTVGPVQIVTRHKAILCNKVYVPSLRGSIHQQPRQAMAGDKPIPARVSSLQQFATIHRGPSIRSVHGEVGTIPDISLEEELAEADIDSVASSPINLSPRSTPEANRVFSSPPAATTPASVISVQEWHYRPHLPDNRSAPVQQEKTYLPYRPPGYLLDNTAVSVEQGKYLPYRPPKARISRAVRLPSYIYLPPHLQRAATPSTLGSPPPELLDPRLPLTAAKIQQVMRRKDLVDAELLDAESGALSTETQFIDSVTPVYPGYDLVTYPFHLDNEVGCEFEDEIDPALLPAVLRVPCPTLEKMATRPSSPPVDAPDVTATWMGAFNSLHLSWPDNHDLAMELMDLSPRDRVARVEQLSIANVPIEVSGTEVQTLPQDPVAVYFDRRISTPTPETVISRRRSVVGLVGVEKFWRDREVEDLIMPKSAPPFPKKSFRGVDEVAAVEVCFCHEMGRDCACPGRGETTGWL
jgi:hypothetical protein